MGSATSRKATETSRDQQVDTRPFLSTSLDGAVFKG